jgi:hypothetical protein
MKVFFRFFFKDGRATWYGSWTGIIGSILVMYGVIHFRLNNVFGWFLLIAAWIVLMVFGLSGRSEALGLKPFTNDPLGWRKAKKSYQGDEASKESSIDEPLDKP